MLLLSRPQPGGDTSGCSEARRVFLPVERLLKPFSSVCCIAGSAALDHSARVEDVRRGIFDSARQCGERRRLWLEHWYRAAQGRRALDERRMPGVAALGPADRSADDFGAGIAGFGNRGL